MALQFKVQLVEIDEPPVWRRIIVPQQFSFWRFHLVLQAAFGWENAHLFQFSPEGWGSQPAIGMAGDWDEGNTQDCKKIKLSQVFKEPGQTYTYIYDFGDDWLHGLWLEEVTGEKLLKATVLAGEGHCPPEDCGGLPGFYEFKRIMADPADPEHAEMKEWLGLGKRQKWDPTRFDLKKAQAAVQRL